MKKNACLIKSFSIVVLLNFVTISTVSCKTTRVITSENTINIIMDIWHKDIANANFTASFNRISNDGFYVGTDSKEIWNKQEFEKFAKPYFDKKETWHFKPIQRNVHFSKNKKIAWFNELLDTWMGTCRGSGILELENGKWKIKQYVLSVTIPNEKMKKVIKIKKEK